MIGFSFMFLGGFVVALMLMCFLPSNCLLDIEMTTQSSVPVSVSLLVDSASLSFSALVSLITASVYAFSHAYMEGEIALSRFKWEVALFVAAMNLLVFSGSFVSLMVGWDGLGLTSFALILFYESRTSLNAGFHTLLVNRIGDCLIILSLSMFLVSGNLSAGSFFLSPSELLLLLAVASMTKSAQVPFSSWLPAAMAAPTPVSALVHSSTLVTAGVFLVIRLSSSTGLEGSAAALLLLAGSATCLVGGWSAWRESDLKKIVAFSTLSQLGVMMFTIGLGYPDLALFHLFVHALFKALLFMAVGHVMMVGGGAQHLSSLAGLGLAAPATSMMVYLSCLSLLAFPFLSSFYSKHLMLEMVAFGDVAPTSSMIMLVATGLTGAYVIRLMISLHKSPNSAAGNEGCAHSLIASFSALSVGAVLYGALATSLSSVFPTAPVAPSSHGMVVYLVTMMGVIVAIVSPEFGGASILGLWYLTPGSSKLFSEAVVSVGQMESGWIEPFCATKWSSLVSVNLVREGWPWPSSNQLVVLLGLGISWMMMSSCL